MFNKNKNNYLSTEDGSIEMLRQAIYNKKIFTENFTKSILKNVKNPINITFLAHIAVTNNLESPNTKLILDKLKRPKDIATILEIAMIENINSPITVIMAYKIFNEDEILRFIKLANKINNNSSIHNVFISGLRKQKNIKNAIEYLMTHNGNKSHIEYLVKKVWKNKKEYKQKLQNYSFTASKQTNMDNDMNLHIYSTPKKKEIVTRDGVELLGISMTDNNRIIKINYDNVNMLGVTDHNGNKSIKITKNNKILTSINISSDFEFDDEEYENSTEEKNKENMVLYNKIMNSHNKWLDEKTKKNKINAKKLIIKTK